MARRDVQHSPPHGRRPVGGTIALLLVLLLVAGAAASYRYGLLDRFLDDDPVPAADPARVPPPEGVDVPDVDAPRPVARSDDGAGPTRLDRAAVRDALAPYLGRRDLGRHVRAVVAAVEGGRPAFSSGSGTAIPASTTKVVTSTAALLAMGPAHVFTTTVVRDDRHVTLVGGGDPFLAAEPDTSGDPHAHPAVADVTTLARSAAKALRKDGVRTVSLSYDTTLFSGPDVNERWEDDYVPDVVSPIESLWVDQGRATPSLDPAFAAAQTFAGALTRSGIKVRNQPSEARAPKSADVIAEMDSAPLEQIVQKTLEVSDNEAAEVLLRHVGLATEGAGSFDAGRRGVLELLSREGVGLGGSVLYDGSGLSRSDRLDPIVLVDVLRLAASSAHPELRSVLTGLPVSGFVGSLADRMDGGEQVALGRVRAKTGTLSNVRSLAGVATDLEGTTFVFVLMSDRIREPNTEDAEVDLDDAAAALGACSCTRG